MSKRWSGNKNAARKRIKMREERIKREKREAIIKRKREVELKKKRKEEARIRELKRIAKEKREAELLIIREKQEALRIKRQDARQLKREEENDTVYYPKRDRNTIPIGIGHSQEYENDMMYDRKYSYFNLHNINIVAEENIIKTIGKEKYEEANDYPERTNAFLVLCASANKCEKYAMVMRYTTQRIKKTYNLVYVITATENKERNRRKLSKGKCSSLPCVVYDEDRNVLKWAGFNCHQHY